jgi:uncharacterized protein (TIGR04255 family)
MDSMTPAPRHFSKAPVIEAIIDIQIAGAPADLLETLENAEMAAGYRQAGTIGAIVGKLEFREDSSVATAKGSRLGYRFHSADDKFVVQIRTNGFTFSRLAPYDRWETFIAEAESNWAHYRRIVEGPGIVIPQFSVRYINKLHMPPGSEVSSYLRTYPEISSELPQVMTNSFMRVELDLGNNLPGATLIHQQFYTQSDQPGQVAMILDNEIRVPYQAPLSDPDLWTTIHKTRVLKNRYFRGCITPLMEEIID